MDDLGKFFYAGKPRKYIHIYLYVVNQSLQLGGNTPPVKQIAKHFGISEQAVYLHFKMLRKHNLISRISGKWCVTGATITPPTISSRLQSRLEKLKS
jgi:predicted DNA-binding transcriptional regulator